MTVDNKKMLDYLTEALANKIKNKSVEYMSGSYLGLKIILRPRRKQPGRSVCEWTFEGVDPDGDD